MRVARSADSARNARMRCAAMLMILACSACATTQSGAPISYGRSGPPPQQQRASAPPAPAPAQRPQQAPPDEADWAAREGASLADYALRPEAVHPHDPHRLPRVHRVGANESLYDIASAYQVPLRALIDQNRLEPPYALTPGMELELPPPRTHRAARGESLEDVARAYNVDLRSLALLNRMQPPYRISAGDEIVLPAVARAHVAPPPQPAQPAPAAQPGRFVWPVRGEVLSGFGAQPGGRRLDGIEIAAREGEPIGAAAAGEVVYAGDDLPAYGTLVLVRHEDGFVTAYGYARRALVQEGQRVQAGEPLAEAGGAQGVSKVLFQVRRGAAAVDPAPLLGGG